MNKQIKEKENTLVYWKMPTNKYRRNESFRKPPLAAP